MRCVAEDECYKKAIARGLCDCHYRMWRIYGRTKRIRRPWGKGTVRSDGYIQITQDGRLKMEHVVMVEEVMGKPLPPEAVIHHVNGEPADNRNDNFVVCPNQEYHMLLHQRSEMLGYFPKTWSHAKQRRRWREGRSDGSISYKKDEQLKRED